MIYVVVLIVALTLDLGNYVAWFAFRQGFAYPTFAGAVAMILTGIVAVGVVAWRQRT